MEDRDRTSSNLEEDFEQRVIREAAWTDEQMGSNIGRRLRIREVLDVSNRVFDGAHRLVLGKAVLPCTFGEPDRHVNTVAQNYLCATEEAI